MTFAEQLREQRLTMAQRLLSENLPKELTQKVTQLSAAEIEALAAKLNVIS